MPSGHGLRRTKLDTGTPFDEFARETPGLQRFPNIELIKQSNRDWENYVEEALKLRSIKVSHVHLSWYIWLVPSCLTCLLKHTNMNQLHIYINNVNHYSQITGQNMFSLINSLNN